MSVTRWASILRLRWGRNCCKDTASSSIRPINAAHALWYRTNAQLDIACGCFTGSAGCPAIAYVRGASLVCFVVAFCRSSGGGSASPPSGPWVPTCPSQTPGGQQQVRSCWAAPWRCGLSTTRTTTRCAALWPVCCSCRALPQHPAAQGCQSGLGRMGLRQRRFSSTLSEMLVQKQTGCALHVCEALSLMLLVRAPARLA